MTTVALIGSGNIGSTIARLAIEAGHQVVLSNSRGPATLADTAAGLGPRASAATSGEAAAAGDIVVVALPVKAFPNLPAAAMAGKTVIDTCNYGPERDGHISELDSTSLTSSELLLRHVPDAVVVKAFNNIFFKHLLSLARPAGAADRSYLPIAADSARAKQGPGPRRRPRAGQAGAPSSTPNRCAGAWSITGSGRRSSAPSRRTWGMSVTSSSAGTTVARSIRTGTGRTGAATGRRRGASAAATTS